MSGIDDIIKMSAIKDMAIFYRDNKGYRPIDFAQEFAKDDDEEKEIMYYLGELNLIKEMYERDSLTFEYTYRYVWYS